MFFFCLACNTVPENWHMCGNKCLTYKLTYKSPFLRSIGNEKRLCSKSRSPAPTDAYNGFRYYTLPSVSSQIVFPELLFRLLPMNSLFYGRAQKRSAGLRCISWWQLMMSHNISQVSRCEKMCDLCWQWANSLKFTAIVYICPKWGKQDPLIFFQKAVLPDWLLLN